MARVTGAPMNTRCEDCGGGQRGGLGRQKLCVSCRLVNGVKVCSKCAVEKPFSQFWLQPSLPDGHRPSCNDCTYSTHQDWFCQKNYGLSYEQVTDMRQKCEVCPATDDLVIDHCHDSGVVRGVLCGRCNKALGLLMDDPTWIRDLADYADKHAHLKVAV